MLLSVTFLLALLLAWPTVGLSLVLWVILFFASAHLKAKARIQAVDERRAFKALDETEDLTPPRWAHDHDEVDTFFQAIERVVAHKGIPCSYVRLQMQISETREMLLGVAGRMEDQGGSFSAQQLACTNFIEKAWQRLAAEHKQRFLALG